MITRSQALEKKNWSEGWMIGRVARVQSTPQGKAPYRNFSITKITLSNLYGNTYDLAFATPHGKEPGRIITDLNELGKQRRDKGRKKFWVEFKMVEKNRFLMLEAITTIPEEWQEEIERLSAIARGVFDNKNMFDVTEKMVN